MTFESLTMEEHRGGTMIAVDIAIHRAYGLTCRVNKQQGTI